MHVKEINTKNLVQNYYYDNLVKAKKKKKKKETKNILKHEKNVKKLGTCFTRYVHSKSIKMLSLHYPELMRKIKEQEERNT